MEVRQGPNLGCSAKEKKVAGEEWPLETPHCRNYFRLLLFLLLKCKHSSQNPSHKHHLCSSLNARDQERTVGKIKVYVWSYFKLYSLCPESSF
jgi:hypothetical protein